MSVTRGMFGLIASTSFSSFTSSTTRTLRYCTRSPGRPTRLTSISGTSTNTGGFAVAAHQEEPARAATDHHEESDRGDDQLELVVLGRRGLGALSRRAAFRFIVSHRSPAPAPSVAGNARVTMVNGIFLLIL